MKPVRAAATRVLTSAALLASGTPALAQSWVSPAPGNWFNPVHWSGGIPNAVGAVVSIGDTASGGSLTSGGTFNGTGAATLGSLAINRETAGPSLFFNGPDFIFDNGSGADVFLDASGILGLQLNSDIELRGQLISAWTASNGRIAGTISGAFGITHNPPFEATLELRGTNTYTGPTRVLNGRLRINQPAALGSPAEGTTIVGPTSSLIFDAPNGAYALEAITLEDGGRLWLRPSEITSGISIATTGGITPWFDDTTAEISGIISGDQLVKSSAQSNITNDPTAEAITYLSSTANTYTGGTLIRSGVLAVAGDGSLGAAGTGITFDTQGFSEGPPVLATRTSTTIDRPITLLDHAGLRADAGTVALYPQPITGAGLALTVNAPAGSGALAGGFSDWTGTVALAAANTYSGGTTVRLGALSARNTTGSATGSGPVVIEALATLTGDGALSGAVDLSAGGQLSPGNPVGALTTGPVTMGPGTTTTIEINSSSEFDSASASGTASLDGSLIAIDNSAGTLTPGDTFDIVTATSITGTFANETLPAGFTVEYLADRVRLTFTGIAGCVEDLDGDLVVSGSDLAVLLASWGQAGVPADFDGGGVSGSDLALLLAAWGPCN